MDLFLQSIAIFVVAIDPLGMVPIFIGLTSHLPRNRLPRTALKDEGANYLRFECESWLFRFVDDFEVFFDEKGRLIHVRSSARTGYWDLGVNRNRTELVRQLLPVEMKVGEPKPTSV